MKDFSLLGLESKEGIKNNESANNRTINLLLPEVKSSLQMSGVKDSQGLYLFHFTSIEFLINWFLRFSINSYPFGEGLDGVTTLIRVTIT